METLNAYKYKIVKKTYVYCGKYVKICEREEK